MATHKRGGGRRRFMAAAGAGLASAIITGRADAAAEPTAAERANIKVVNDFCAAFAADDVDRIMGFFADPCSYRMTEEREPIKGFAAVKAQIAGLVKSVDRFEVLDSFTRGPMVFNERIDYFTPGGSVPLKSWRGVGVFLMKAGKIVEWQDFTISIERA